MIDILPDFLKSYHDSRMGKSTVRDGAGKDGSGQFMTGIEKLLSMMLNHCDSIPEEGHEGSRKKESVGNLSGPWRPGL